MSFKSNIQLYTFHGDKFNRLIILTIDIFITDFEIDLAK
jgi:hypothetical protein